MPISKFFLSCLRSARTGADLDRMQRFISHRSKIAPLFCFAPARASSLLISIFSQRFVVFLLFLCFFFVSFSLWQTLNLTITVCSTLLPWLTQLLLSICNRCCFVTIFRQNGLVLILKSEWTNLICNSFWIVILIICHYFFLLIRILSTVLETSQNLTYNSHGSHEF